MTGPEHYQLAETLLQMASDVDVDPVAPYAHEQYLLATAQVHATLAVAAALTNPSGTMPPAGA